MNTPFNFTRALIIVTVLFTCIGHAQETKREFYELKTYLIKNEDQENRVDHYLKNAYLPALKRQGIKNIGVFKVRPNKFTKADKIYILIPFASLDQFEKLEASIAVDKEHLSSGKDYITAKYNDPPYQRISSTLMRAFSGMPHMRPSQVSTPRSERVYELRSYESPTEATYKNKVAMFNEGGEVDLFESIGANAVFYAEVISGSQMPNLMYMTTYADMAQRDALWEKFFASEKWTELKNDEHYKNNMNKADIFLLYPTSYSDY
ncbi:NIPSNAP family protein [Maribacter thermophilus]|uniref:NIPSNAP family protein n=1 Tax=Maribacter thermophilus TaxID=1197874 RepID=UPI0006417E8F|nr:NIPSNAP family protein [Maribacter thermophilus]